MKKSEKLLDIIGQIDDRLIEEAAHAGAGKADRPRKNKRRLRKYKRRSQKYLQGTLTACAILAICVGIWSVMAQTGTLPERNGAKSSAPEMAADTTAEMAADTTAEMAADTTPEMAADTTAEMAKTSRMMTEDAAPEDIAPEDAIKEKAADEAAVEAEKDGGAEKDGRAEGKALAQAGNAPEKASGEAAKDALSRIEMQNGCEPQFLTVTVLVADAGSVTYLLQNDTGMTISVGSAYYLEERTEEGWQEIPCKAEAEWKADFLDIVPGESAEQTVEFARIYGKMDKGQYRVVRDSRFTESEEFIPLYIEFTVE